MNKIKQEICRNIQKRQQNKINNELAKKKKNITQDELEIIKQYNAQKLNILQKILNILQKNSSAM